MVKKCSRQKKRWRAIALGWSSVLIFFLISSCQQRKQPSLQSRAFEIHQRVLTVDTHADTPLLMVRGDWDMGTRHQPGGGREGKVDLPRMKEGGLDALFFAVYTAQREMTPLGYAKARESAEVLLSAIHKMCSDYPHLVELAKHPEDAYRLKKEGKIAAFIGMENGFPLGKDLSLLKKYHEMGVRYLTLCHSQDNEICDSSTERRNPEDMGLSDFGKEVVAECNRLGIMVDISHASNKSFFDVLKITKAPVIASHSGVRALCDHPRNLSDEMLRALASNGGVIQVPFVSSFIKKAKPNPEREKALESLKEKYGRWEEIRDEEILERMREEYSQIQQKFPEERATVEDLVNHIDYVVKLIGIDYVGIGSDFDGGGELDGCYDVTEIRNITRELIRRGYGEKEIEKIWGGNIMRVFKKVVKVAKELQKSISFGSSPLDNLFRFKS